MSIEELVTELLVQWENHPASSPEELCRDYLQHPEHAALLEAVKLAIRDIEAADSMLATPHEDDSGSRATPGPFQPKLPSTVPPSPMPSDTDLSPAAGTVLGSRYRPQSFHARGGLGEVWRAEDEELHREVALKRIQERHRGNAESLRRFLREAEITAKLQHPGVVPVHGLGCDADGRLCYAMRFIEGAALDEALKRFHDADREPRRDPAERSLALRELLNRFIAVCNTVAYAHSRGILHRDLKPSNIMMGDYGETLVVDWGMAKPFARTEVERSTGEATLMPPATEDSPEGATQHGQALGTPAYMSPEQAAGRWDAVGPASDIFSLGATLYAILTGQPPYRGRNQEEVLRKAGNYEFPPPRQVKPAVPRALEAICLKAMALKAEERYGTARELGADVEKWLADEIVTAWLEPFTARARRWMRRHRAVVASTAAALVVALLASTAGLFVLAAAERTERGLRQTAQEKEQIAQVKEQEALGEKAKAEAAQKQTMQALRATTDEVTKKLIGAKPALGPTEREFLKSTLKRWQTFAAEKGEGKAARSIRAEGLARVATLRGRLGQPEQAVAEYEEAIELLKKLAAEFFTEPSYRQVLAISQNNLGFLLRDLGKRPEAEGAIRQALAIQDKLAADFPAVPEYRQELARSCINLGKLLRDLGKRPEAEGAIRQALAIHHKLAADFPDVPEYRLELANGHNNLGVLLFERGKRPEAEEAIRQALATLDKLAAEFPTVREHLQTLANIHNSLGVLLRNLGKQLEAEAAYRQALTLREKLAADFPAMPDYRQDLATTYINLGNLLDDLGKRPEAEAAYRQALSINEKLAADFPTVPEYRQDLAISHNQLGILLDEQVKRGEAEAAYRQALAIREKLAADFATVPQYRIELGGTQVNFGNLQGRNQQQEQALQWFDRSIETLEGVLRQVKVDAKAKEYLRNAHWGRAQALDDLNRQSEAAKDWDKAVELSAEPERPQLRMGRATSRLRAGQVGTALKDAEEMAKIQHPVILYNAACVFALAADRRDEPGGSLSKEECVKRAIALLQQAIAKGYKDAEHMKKDDDLKALRERDDFKKLVAALEAAKPEKP
jgi:serine/threonine-protein kinase